jgi:site-specific DNA recombinase
MLRNLGHDDVNQNSPPVPMVGPLPRPTRKRLRAREDRGLPEDAELWDLATAYLSRQRLHWPELVKRGILPELTGDLLQTMCDDFKRRHRTGSCELKSKAAILQSLTLGGSYSRYSCDNSNPKSIVDQLANQLDCARAHKCFVPWEYVFCDYSISGLDSSRQGYRSYKSLLADARHAIEITFIDDFTRASRDELEWWNLAARCKQLGKGLIGASDGFNLADPNSDVLITVYGLVSRLFDLLLKTDPSIMKVFRCP